MVALFCWFGLLICLIFIFWHLVRPLGDGWNAGFWCILTVNEPFYHSLSYLWLWIFLFLSLARLVSLVFSGCFFSLVFLFACFSFLCSLWLAFQVLPGPCNLHRPGGIPRIALGKEGKKSKKFNFFHFPMFVLGIAIIRGRTQKGKIFAIQKIRFFGSPPCCRDRTGFHQTKPDRTRSRQSSRTEQRGGEQRRRAEQRNRTEEKSRPEKEKRGVFVALSCFCFLFCKCFGIPNSPRSLDLDDRQGLIASSAMQ